MMSLISRPNPCTNNAIPTNIEIKVIIGSTNFAIDADIDSKLDKTGSTALGAKNNDANIAIPKNIKTNPKPIFNQDTLGSVHIKKTD